MVFGSKDHVIEGFWAILSHRVLVVYIYIYIYVYSFILG